ncbi:hypothetical protein FQZ97_986770 [compost metagenome]
MRVVHAQADDVHRDAEEGHRDLDACEVIHAHLTRSRHGTILSPEFIVVGQGPQLHAVGLGALRQRLGREGAVGDDGVAVQVGVGQCVHRVILGFTHSPCVSQAGRDAVDRNVDAAAHAFVAIGVVFTSAVAPHQFHLQVVQRVDVGETVAHGALQRGVVDQALLFTGDERQRIGRAVPLGLDGGEHLLAQALVGHQL